MRNNRVIVAMLCLCAGATAQTVDFGKNHRAAVVSRHGISAIEFDLDADWARPGTNELSFRLPDRPQAVWLNLGEFESRGGGNGVWRGSVEKRADSDVMLTLRDGYVAGTIRMGGDLYEVRPGPGGQVVEKIDSSTYGVCAGAVEAPAGEDAADLRGAQGRFAAATQAPTAATGAHTIDLLSVYSPQARAAAGGAAQIAAVIQAAVDAANQAFSNSGVNINYRLVRTAEAAHDDAGSMALDLSWLINDAATAALRTQVGADLVSLVVENGGGNCGMGYAMRSPGAGFAGAAMQVTARNCAVGNLSFAHEHGHNLGMEHNAANAPAPANTSYPWSFGSAVNGVFRTVMSYSNTCPNGCARVPYFSNPNVSYLGYPTGIANAADNAQTANLTAAIVAAFRSAPVVAPPGAPASLTAIAISAARVNVLWARGSSDENGFRIERSVGGSGFIEIVAVGAGVTSWEDLSVTASTDYSFRVRAYNSNGNSEYSNTASATTPALPQVPAAPTGLNAKGVSSSQIDVSWTDASNDETGFRIERASGVGGFVEIATLGSGVTSYADNGLAAGTAYSYRVRGYNATGPSAYSNSATATTSAAAISLSAPVGFSGAPWFFGGKS